jgi:hypothetical protein
MGQIDKLNYEGVLKAIQQWPPAQQIELVQEVLRAMSPRISLPAKRQLTHARALGLLANEKPAPTDDEVKQWLEERRVERYG